MIDTLFVAENVKQNWKVMAKSYFKVRAFFQSLHQIVNSVYYLFSNVTNDAKNL